MPRDSSGTYSLPAGNPVASGTVITSNWANNTMSDLGVAMTDSLSRTGLGGMLAPMEFVNGEVLLPSIAFGQEPSLGFYRALNQDMRAAVANRDVTRFTLTNQLEVLRDHGSGLLWYRVVDSFELQAAIDAI